MASFQQYQDLSRLLAALQHPDYTTYSASIRTRLQALGKYDPDNFKRLMSDSSIRDRYVRSLQNVIQRWQDRLPVVTSEISDISTIDTYRMLAFAIRNEKWGEVRSMVHKLGFSPTVSENLESNPDFRRQTYQIISDKMQEVSHKYPWLRNWATPLPSFPPEQIDMDVFQDYLTQNYIQGDLRRELYVGDQGVKSLRFNALMANPRAISAAEKQLNLPITGDKDTFLKNYRGKYYTSDCSKYNSSFYCHNMVYESGSDADASDHLRQVLESGVRRDISGDISLLAIYGRYDVITQTVDQFIEQTDDLELIAFISMEIAESAASKAKIDIYQKYFNQGMDIYHEHNLDGDAKYRLDNILRNLLRNAVYSGNWEPVSYTHLTLPTKRIV